MATSTILQQLGFERAVSVNSNTQTDSQSAIVELVKEFGIDKIYFCDDENNSYPAVFLKQVASFDVDTLIHIAKIQRQIWNYKKVLFLYVYNETEIRIYNCAEKPFAIKQEDTNYEKELQKLEIKRATISDKESFNDLNKVFSSIAIDTGIIWTLEEAAAIRDKIDLQRRVDKFLVESLFNTAKELKNQGLGIDLIHKIIMRSLFLLYLEDRKATDEKFYSQFKPNATTYFNILEDVKATYALYTKLAERFNGSLFTLTNNEIRLNLRQLQLIKECFISGNDGSKQTKLFTEWRLFDFKIIQIELLSEIYENFLARIDPSTQQQTGTYYTPPSLVELILNEKLPINNREGNYDLRILDPACGSGIFLVESFKRLVKRHENKYNKKLSDFDELKTLLTNNIFGIELQPQAIKVAAFSLYLALVDNLNPKTIWQEENNKLPALINNPNDDSLKIQGYNLFCRDTIEENKEIEEIKFDLVVGNPPFGTTNLLQSIRHYCDKNGFAKDMVLPFLHKAIKFSPTGEIALIFNTKLLTNTGSTYQKFREWLFNETYVEKVYNFSILRKAPQSFGGQLFGSAVGPISIVFYKKEIPRNASDRIIYYAPKTYVKSNILEGVSIDSTDVKFLPREECQKPETKIWKIAMWGGMGDYSFINKLKQSNSLEKYLNKKGIKKGVGLQFLDKSTKKIYEKKGIPQTYILPKNIGRYKSYSFSKLKDGLTKKSIILYENYYGVSFSEISTIDVFRRINPKYEFKAPQLLVKEGLLDWKICSSFINKSCVFNSNVLGLSYHDDKVLKGLTCFINSKLAYYFLFIYSASIGIERERIKPNEIYSLPFNLDDSNLYYLAELYEKYFNDDNFLNQNIYRFEKEIDNYIFSLYEFSSDELNIIDDFIKYSLPLLSKKNNLPFNPVDVNHCRDYSNKICTKLNDFLDGQNLFANATVFDINKFSPLMAIKVSFDDTKKNLFKSEKDINNELKILDRQLWEEKAANIYFRKKLNYKVSDEVYYIIRPNQKRFWTETMAMEDASGLILEILNED